MSSVRWRAMTCWITFIITTSLCLSHTVQGYKGRRYSETTRVFYGAPRGYIVYEVPREMFSDAGQIVVTEYVMTGADEAMFLLSDNKVKVDEYPRLSKPIGSAYSISIQVTTITNAETDLVAVLDLQLLVSEKNKFRPQFTSGTTKMEVFRYSSPGRRIGQAEALDRDTESYNRRLTYSLIRPYLQPVAIDPSTGVLTAKETLRDAPSMFQVEVITTDAGSPEMSASTNLTLLVRDISEPMNVSVLVHNTTAARICWQRPRYGRCTSYELTFGSSKYQDARRTVLQRVSTPLLCTQLTNLRSFEENWVQIRGLNGLLMGVPVKMYFYMEKNYCANKPCGAGTCVQLRDDPGYRCTCPDGHTGRSCQHLMACTGPECHVADADRSSTQCDCKQTRTRLTKYCEQHCAALQITSCDNGGTLLSRHGKTSCKCPKGYYGDMCKMFDLCTSALCHNGGTCRNVSSTQFQCECTYGYFGETCEHFDHCSLEPCKNGGYCKNVSDSEYYCYCYYGYYGDNCTRYDPCASAPCQNNGICKNMSDTQYMCKCQSGFYGYECEMYSPCLEDPCLNGGMCNSIDGKIVCECTYGRFGPRCEHVNLCHFTDPCGEHAVQCHNVSDASYKCICEPGWSGVNCTTFDPCFTNPCQHSGACRRITTMDYTCRCQSGYYGGNCEYLNHCTSSPCKNNGACRNVSVSDYQCRCTEGYFGKRCESFNPCTKGGCLNGATCVNTSSSTYQCICSSFYFGELCQYYNTCAISPCKNGVCKMTTNGKYSCRCNPGFSGDHCDVFDPCSSSPCGSRGKCINMLGEQYKCSCIDHFYGTNCLDYDSCHSSPCKYGQCTNKPNGRYHCSCPHGKFGDKCDDVDPCADQPCGNDGSCYSIDMKHFSCKCGNGYYGERCEMTNPCVINPCMHGSTCEHLGDDEYRCECSIEFQGENCVDEIPCNSHGKRCYNDGKCKTFQNGTVYCHCPEGWFGFRCENYNPCSSTNACLNSGTCKVLDNGMFTCLCQTGFFGDRCEYHEPCSLYICKNNGTCVHSTKGEICYCKPGFLGKLCEIDIDECISSPCDNDGTCVDLPGGFTCMCPRGFTGPDCNDIAEKCCKEEQHTLQEMCRREELHTARGTFVWPSTGPGKEIKLECSRRPGRFAYRNCVLDGHKKAIWEKVNDKECPLTVQSAEEAINALQPFTNASTALRDVFEVAEAVKLLEITLTYAYTNDLVAAQMLTVVDELLDLPMHVLFDSNSTEKILTVLERVMSNVKLSGKLTFTKRNFAVEIRTVTYTEHDGGTYFSPSSVPGVEFMVPAEVFQKDVSSERIKFIYFNSSKLFHQKASIDDWMDVGDVISAKLGFNNVYDLKSCVHYIMPNKRASPNNRCVFWDEKESTWNSWGVETVSYRGLRTKCCSTHLTSFAVVVDAEIAEISHVEEDWYFSMFSHLGESVAIFCLSVVLLTYSIFRSLNKENFGQLLLQMTGSLLFMNVCVMLGSNRFQVDNDEVCFGVAILVHYFLLSSLTWTCVLGHHLTRIMETDFTRVDTVFLCKRCIFAWGVPFIPVAITLGVNMDGYRRNPVSCFLSADNKYVFCSTYVLPGLCCLVLNGVIIGVLIKALCVGTKTSHKAAPIPISQILGVLAAQVLMGLSWLAAYISTISSILDYSIYFIFMHFTLNGVLGVVILFFHFMLRKDARAAWLQCCAKQKSYVSNRRRVAGKGTVSTRNPSNKTEGDYTLVIDRAAQKEGAAVGGTPVPSPEQVSCTTNRASEAPDLTSNTVRSRTTRDDHRHNSVDRHRHNVHAHHDNLPPVYPSYRMLSDSDMSSSSPLPYGRERHSPGSMYAHCSKHQHIDYDTHSTMPYERNKSRHSEQHMTLEHDRHKHSSPRRSSKSSRQDGLVNTRV